MNPHELGRKYDAIAAWWHDRHSQSTYGLAAVDRALGFCTHLRRALDVGCGAGGRLVRRMQENGLTVTGIDVSAEMIRLARQNHPESHFQVADIVSWQTEERFDLILAWDSIFHLPLAAQKPTVEKLCALLAEGGVLVYTFGNAVGEHTDTWHDDTFYYSSIGIPGNLRVLKDQGMEILHLELDQYPQKHVVVIARRPLPEEGQPG